MCKTQDINNGGPILMAHYTYFQICLLLNAPNIEDDLLSPWKLHISPQNNPEADK